MDFFDPHFHIWDVSGLHDKDILFKPHDKELYDVDTYEKDLKDCEMKHVGGTFLEAMSVCYPDEKNEKTYSERCVKEAEWAQENLTKSNKKYILIPTVQLESVGTRENILSKLSKMKNVRGIRQILNFKPSWPRNKSNLLEDSKWIDGFRLLEKYNLSFDMQLNPSQYHLVTSLVGKYSKIRIIINHLGTPTLKDFRSETYWKGMRNFAKHKHVFLKISMLNYIDPKWDENDDTIAMVREVIDMFGPDRCFFCSNYPVELKDGWPAKRLFAGFRKIASVYTLDAQRQLFSKSAMLAYNVMN